LKPIKFNPNDPKLWKDFDPTEQAEEFVDNKDEIRIQRGARNRTRAENPDWYENLILGQQKFFESDKFEKTNEQRRLKSLENNTTEEYKESQRQQSLLNWQDQDYVKKNLENRKEYLEKYNSDLELQKSKKEKTKQMWEDNNKRSQIVNSHLKRYQDPEFKERFDKSMKERDNAAIIKKRESNPKNREAFLKAKGKPLMTPNGRFEYRGQAAEHYSIVWKIKKETASGKILKLIKDPLEKDWYYI